MLAYINFPVWLKPEIIPGLPLRWYGLMYLVAFSIAYLLIMRQIKEKTADGSKILKTEFTEEDVINCFFWGIVGLLLGARILSATVYDPSHYYLTHPWMIFWPFRGGHFTGLQGMSYHGGVIGGILATIIYCRIKKKNWFLFADITAAGIPLGYTFGRLGNFINGELWGRVTTRAWGVIFPYAERFPVTDEWVTDVAAKIGMELPQSEFVNLPRHPSQLYEAFFEGVFLWLFLWFIIKRRKRFNGAVVSFYLIGYGVVRFFIEYFREPDRDLGFILQFGKTVETTALFHPLLSFSTGQILCALMIIGGAVLYFGLRKRTANGTIPDYVSAETESKDSGKQSKNAIRNKRKKIKS